MKPSIMEIAQSGSRLSFSTRHGNERPWWRYLDIDNQPLYLIGNICETCDAIFGLAGEANLPLTSREVSEKFRLGIVSVSPVMLDTLAHIFPNGKYVVGLITLAPRLIESPPQQKTSLTPAKSTPPAYFQDPAYQHQNRPDYYWEHQTTINDNWQELILPIVAQSKLDEQRILAYQQQLSSGAAPTALSLSVVDIRIPFSRYYESFLAHFLLDGHHKMMAASRLGLPMTLLSFLSVDNSFAPRDDFQAIVASRFG